jgi:hypothetical protein
LRGRLEIFDLLLLGGGNYLPYFHWHPVNVKFFVGVAPGGRSNWLAASKKTGRLDGLQSGDPGFMADDIGVKAWAFNW